MGETSSNPSMTLVLELGDRVRRSWWTVIAGASLGLAGATVALQHMPKVYQATTRIWISEQEISDRVVQSTVKDDMALKLAAFRDAVLADEYMIELVEKTFGPPETDAELTARMGQIRGNVSIDTVQSRAHGVQAFALAYRDTDPRRAANVVNMLTRLYVSQNSEFRKRSAVKVAETIQDMADKAKVEFDEIDGKLTRFKQAHQFETEQHLGMNVQMLDGRKRDVETLNSRRDLLRRDLQIAEDDLAKARAQAQLSTGTTSGSIVIDPLTQSIARAKSELEKLRVRYTEEHPEVHAKRRELEDLLAQARNRVDQTDEEDPSAPVLSSNPVIAAIQTRVQNFESQMAKLDSEEKLLQREIAEYKRRIEVVPEVQRQLTDLEEEHAVAQEKYRRLEREAEGAKGSIDLEETNMAQGMEILTEAGVPSSPIEPDPKNVYMIFLAGGVALFVGPMLVRQLLSPPVTSEAGLRTLTPVPVLVTIPRILTPANRGLGRRNLAKNIALAALAAGVFLSVKFYI